MSDAATPSGPDLTPTRAGPGHVWGLALLPALVGLGFAVPWWLEKGALVYVERLAAGFILCL